MCLNVLSTCTYVYHMHAHRGHKKTSDPLELKLQMVSYELNPGPLQKQTSALNLSHHSSPEIFFLK